MLLKGVAYLMIDGYEFIILYSFNSLLSTCVNEIIYLFVTELLQVIYFYWLSYCLLMSSDVRNEYKEYNQTSY